MADKRRRPPTETREKDPQGGSAASKRASEPPAKRKFLAATDKNGRRQAERARRDVIARRFAENVPEDEFTEALRRSPDPKMAAFLAARADPAHRRTSFSTLLRRFNVSVQDVHELWRRHQLDMGMIQMMNHVPRVLEDVAIDATSKSVCCPRCEGEKVVVMPETGVQKACPVCEGSGKVRVIGDKGSRDLLFESIGLTGKRPPAVAIQQNFGLESGLEELLMGAHKIIHARARPLIEDGGEDPGEKLESP